jgi:membrane protein YqaA with SNARE-associated domain
VSVDRWLRSRTALVVAFLWGLAEATLFFIVPDVFLTAIGCRALRPAMKATFAALLGALVGGAIMFGYGQRRLVEHVPGVSPRLVDSVDADLRERGILAVLTGPLKGVPYKIYAVEWHARGGALLPFLLISIPARCVRFALSVLVARGVANLLARWTQRRVGVELTILTIFWVAFYAFYFTHFGW